MTASIVVISLLVSVAANDAAKILGVFPVPSISHQIVFTPLMSELARRGHDVIVITTDPVFPKGKTPENFTEIDVHDISYELWKRHVLLTSKVSTDDQVLQMKHAFEIVNLIFKAQMMTEEVKEVINRNAKFDFLVLEICVKPVLALSHLIKAPVIQNSSLGAVYDSHKIMGSSIHPLLYPMMSAQRIYNLTMTQKLKSMYDYYLYTGMYSSLEADENKMLRKLFGDDTLPLNELTNNVDMLFLNVHPIWEDNRPVPPNVVYVGCLNELPEKKLLPKDLQKYLDSSNNGVIYISFGSNILPSMLSPEKIEILIGAFAKLPYDVLFKWDKEKLPGNTKNVKTAKWFPQTDILRHPNTKAFITQGGLQSTCESIKCGVPLIGIPLFSDQWYNVEKYVRHGIGLRLDLEKLNEDKVIRAVRNVVEDNSYRQNVKKLNEIMNDMPQSPLERAVWWTEHILRHGGGKHLRAPAANMSWTEYLELELVVNVALFLIITAILILLVGVCSIKLILRFFITEKKCKEM
ncbi:hypothetical protein K1T71_012516 [Dendrolimus kikuchii]|uniref:Uncharacterized protein n=1 Tax=Dendrolimus kikuchii TaxID=765133 RepID=A0ACC1CJI8_9NEOP|nr:hypothetical protein K1T71_012516 [Dendrolimus kikuchii]